MKYLSFLILFSITALQSHAKVWRINNNSGVVADFTSCVDALASDNVVDGDTLHVEGSANAYSGFTLNKRLVMIGTGYFLSGSNSNSGQQANANSSSFANGYISFDSASSGSTLIGLDNFIFSIGPNLGSATDNITLIRCNVANIGINYGYTANTKMVGWKINKCHINTIAFSGISLQNWEITNNIIQSSIDMSSTSNINILVRNNVFRSGIILFSCYFSNNIITNAAFITVNTTIKNNLSSGTNLPSGNGNVSNQSDAVVFQGLIGNSSDGQWRLKAGSPAVGAGETIAGITPDCGAFGTADPYVLSGIPAIPTIYLLTVPANVATNAATMPITISTKSRN